ncbi:hypothetical protein SLEP1_g51287 [Rubroshorea leprosula]|uniref:Bifunctional inhibitor/plant lipid transfer protein/seed storage helical domain-containing protein n=1 Tax=Rubroshorea leprosula TaxID=152421 RepID=A0AAV5M2R8_9ROSI|nr:hypothetical protein SLEP1_g51287 [Rubroshorea leprosula]
MPRISFVVYILTCLAALATSARPRHHDPQESSLPAPVRSPNLAPGPSVDCSSAMYDLVDCIGYLSYGSNDTKPEKSCCSGFKSMMKVAEQCICEAIKSSRGMGIELNLTRAASLPSDCGVSAPPISTCGISLSPSTAPSAAPSAAPPIPVPATSPPNKEPLVPEPATPEIVPGTTPSPSPLPHAGAHGLSTPFSLLLAMLLASFFYLAM